MNNKKKIALLQINVTANKGSHGKIAEEIGKLVKELGWRSVIAYGREANLSQSELLRIGSGVDVIEHVIESRLLDNHGLASRRATKKLIQQINEIKPDIIHLHNIHGYYSNYRLLFNYLNKLNIPVVWTLHDCWSFTGHCSHFESANCDRWKTLCLNCPLKNDYPKSWLIDSSKKNYKLKKELFSKNENLHFIPVSDWLNGLLNDSFLKDCDRRVVHNGVNLAVFFPQRENNDDIFRIIGVSNIWTERKGLYDFYKLREVLDVNLFQITIVGLNEKQIKELPKGIEGIQRTDSVEELAKMYSNADVFVNLTYADTFPTVNIEALACGTPVVTYETGGSPEIVDEKTGIVVEQGNIKDLVIAIHKIKNLSPEERQELRMRCRKRAEENYEKNRQYAEYVRIYQTLLGGF